MQLNKPQNGLFQKKNQTGGLRIYFCENCSGIFHSFTLSLEIPDKTKLNPWIFHTIVLPRSLRSSKAKNKDPWKFHIIFSCSPLAIPCAISLMPQEIPYPQPPCLFGFFLEQPNCFLYLTSALFYYLSIIIADQTCYSIDRQGELLVKLIFSDLTSSSQSVCCQSCHQVIQMMCATFAICLGILFLTE